MGDFSMAPELGFAFLVVISLVLYMIPALVAAGRSRAILPITLLNVFLGWTLIGWVGALVWAATERTAREESKYLAKTKR